jgi:hypothetical protein
VSELTRDGENGDLVTIAHALRGSTLWVVYEKPRADGLGERRIEAFVGIRKDSDGYGYSHISESDGPVALSCPLSFFDLAPNPLDGIARKWRDRVRAVHAETARALQLYRTMQVGTLLELRHWPGESFRVFAAGFTQCPPRKAEYGVWARNEATRGVLRVTPGLLRGAVVVVYPPVAA